MERIASRLVFVAFFPVLLRNSLWGFRPHEFPRIISANFCSLRFEGSALSAAARGGTAAQLFWTADPDCEPDWNDRLLARLRLRLGLTVVTSLEVDEGLGFVCEDILLADELPFGVL